MAGSQRMLKRLNRMAIVRHVKARPGLVRGELAALIGLAESTISVLVGELIKEGWLRQAGARGTGAPGRRARFLELDPTRLAILGAEVGDDYLNVVACGLQGELLFSRMTDYRHTDLATSVRDVATLIVEARAAVVAGKRRVLGLGVGVPGMVGIDGLVRLAPSIGWRDVPFGQRLMGALRELRFPDLPVTVLNDANAAALSEHVFGAGPAVGSLIFLSLGYGIGAGIVLDDRLHLGHDGLAGEVGHTILQPGGTRCACGRRGCTETLISQKVISRLATGREEPVLHVAELVERLEQGDATLRQVVRDAGDHLGLVLQNLVVTINPEVLILGGPLSRLQGLVDAAIESLTRLSGDLPYHHAEVRVCRFGLNAAAVGAAGSVLHQALHPLARSLASREPAEPEDAA
jgi:predicted NBD/HSP70 family sugar kinase